jgi:hypothetical protein
MTMKKVIKTSVVIVLALGVAGTLLGWLLWRPNESDVGQIYHAQHPDLETRGVRLLHKSARSITVDWYVYRRDETQQLYQVVKYVKPLFGDWRVTEEPIRTMWR